MNDQTLEELLEGWKEETITTREALDQILRHMLLLRERMRALERQMFPSPPPAPTPRRPAGKRR